MCEDGVKAERALAVRDWLLPKVKTIDEALTLAAATALEVEKKLRELNHDIGCPYFNEHQFKSLGTRAAKSPLMFSPLQVEHLAPGERRTFAETMASWVLTISNWAEKRLVKPETTEAA
jgi:hypothetical protein